MNIPFKNFCERIKSQPGHTLTNKTRCLNSANNKLKIAAAYLQTFQTPTKTYSFTAFEMREYCFGHFFCFSQQTIF